MRAREPRRYLQGPVSAGDGNAKGSWVPVTRVAVRVLRLVAGGGRSMACAATARAGRLPVDVQHSAGEIGPGVGGRGAPRGR